jgi:hypothetical protein
MVQMGANSIFADGYGMRIVGISRRYVADVHFGPLRCWRRWFACSDAVAMVQMGANSIFADGNGMRIVGISRRYVADIHFSPLR